MVHAFAWAVVTVLSSAAVVLTHGQAGAPRLMPSDTPDEETEIVENDSPAAGAAPHRRWHNQAKRWIS
jgi:hypothetical protein